MHVCPHCYIVLYVLFIVVSVEIFFLFVASNPLKFKYNYEMSYIYIVTIIYSPLNNSYIMLQHITYELFHIIISSEYI